MLPTYIAQVPAGSSAQKALQNVQVLMHMDISMREEHEQVSIEVMRD